MKQKIIICNLKGAFGNQLFQYATAYSLAKRNNAILKLDLSFFENEKYSKLFKLDRLNIKIEKASKEEIEGLKNKPNAPLIYKVLRKLGIKSAYNKKTDIVDGFGFKPDKKILGHRDSAYLVGWCLAEAYFSMFRGELLSEYTLKKPLTSAAQKYLSEINAANSVSVHIRRGDYLNLEHFFRIIPVDYFKKSIEIMKEKIENPMFYFFSNDLDWVKKNLNFDKNFVFVNLKEGENYDGEDDMEDFFLMRNCKHNIIANSSFSWWAAYLNENASKSVIAPSIWYNDKFYQKSMEKYPICPKDWALV